MLGIQELVVILLIVVLVFGAKRIPEIMDSLGKGIKTFKKAIDEDDVGQTVQPPNMTASSDKLSSRVADGEEVSHPKNEPK